LDLFACCLPASLVPLKIVYNIVFNLIMGAPEIYRRSAGCGRSDACSIWGTMAGKPLDRANLPAPKSRPMPEPAAREPAAAVLIARRIEEDIVLGRRQPRERLVEQDLCDLFQTHRGDVRLALFELEKKGLVERIPNRGAMVRGLTPLEVREIYAVREELEVMAVRIIPFPVGPQDIESLEELQRQH